MNSWRGELSWDGALGALAEVKTLKGHLCRVSSVAFNDPEKDEKNKLRVVTASEDGTAKVWNVLELTPGRNLPRGWKEIGSDTYTLDVYEAPRHKLWLLRQPLRKLFSMSLGLKEINRVQAPMHTAAYSPVDDNIVVTSGEEGVLRVWDVASSSPVLIIQGHHDRVRSVNFISTGEDKTVRLWNLCKDGGNGITKRSVVANLTTEGARDRLRDYCSRVEGEQLP